MAQEVREKWSRGTGKVAQEVREKWHARYGKSGTRNDLK